MLFSEDTLADFFEKQVERLPDHEFLIYPDRNLRFTYSEFNERANNLAKGLLSIGVGKGDHVGIWAKNVPEWLTFMFATAKIGAVLVTVNTAYKSHELEYILKQSDMKALALTDRFRDNNYIDIIYDLVPELKTCQRGKLTSEKFPCLKHVIHVGQDKHRGMYNTNELLLLGQNQDDVILKEIKKEFDNNDVVNMQYTSGTEGFPKGVMLTSRNIFNDFFCFFRIFIISFHYIKSSADYFSFFTYFSYVFTSIRIYKLNFNIWERSSYSVYFFLKCICCICLCHSRRCFC